MADYPDEFHDKAFKLRRQYDRGLLTWNEYLTELACLRVEYGGTFLTDTVG